MVTLTTDFGTRDPWVGIMKGVILARCRDAVLVDLTHEVAPQDVLGGQLALAAATPYFPAGTVHLAVVDPGVGTARRPLAVAAGGQCFVGPDNGLFSFLFERPGWTAVELAVPAHRLAPVSRTFHGRDVFAPAAAALAAGVPLARLGPRVTDPVRRPLPRAHRQGRVLHGEVLQVDRFGNLITSITARDLAGGRAAAVEAGGRRLPLVEAYGAASPGGTAALVDSTDRLEIFAREGSAARRLGLGRGAPVRVRLAGPVRRRSARARRTSPPPATRSTSRASGSRSRPC
jgi:hypothetical protein